jgi:thiamine biosynthesis lipoprotein
MQKYSFEQTHMNTRVNITLHTDGLYDTDKKKIKNAFAIFNELEKQFTLFKISSEISRINRQAGTITKVTPLFLATLQYAVQIAEASQGLFDPLVGKYTLPRSKSLREKKLSNYQNIIINDKDETIFIPPKNYLDLNSIVKGMALDKALECFSEQDNLMIEAGGDIVVQGQPAEKNFWDIGIRNPHKVEKIITTIQLTGGAICTSGGYFRKNNNGHHLINPNNGQSPDDILSLTVIAPRAQIADTLSTAAFFMPIEDGIDFMEKFKGTSSLIIDKKLNIFMSPRMKEIFTNL